MTQHLGDEVLRHVFLWLKVVIRPRAPLVGRLRQYSYLFAEHVCLLPQAPKLGS